MPKCELPCVPWCERSVMCALHFSMCSWLSRLKVVSPAPVCRAWCFMTESPGHSFDDAPKMRLLGKISRQMVTSFLYPSPMVMQLNVDPSLGQSALRSTPPPLALWSGKLLCTPGPLGLHISSQLVPPSKQGNVVFINSLWIWSLEPGLGVLYLH